MNSLCADIGTTSINHVGEQLCGDHVDIIEGNDESIVMVLADGLGSGVKASILSTLTSKIISTMLSQGMTLEDCVETIAQTLPICSIRGVAYSTFTIIKIAKNKEAEIIQYDNPHVIMLRNGKNYNYQKEELQISGKRIFKSNIILEENDVFVAMSDGCPHAGLGNLYNFGWRREDIIEFLETVYLGGYTAKTISTVLVAECNKLYGEKPGDDATACVIKIRKRVPINILFGPPAKIEEQDEMLSLFFKNDGKHIVSGGTTSTIVAKYLGKEVRPSLSYDRSGLPPIAEIDGVDLVTEGVITMDRVLQYAKDYVGQNQLYEKWCYKHNGAALISKLLFEEATDINFFVGRAINPSHQNPDLPINFNIKMNLVKELSECLRRMGKKVIVSYY